MNTADRPSTPGALHRPATLYNASKLGPFLLRPPRTQPFQFIFLAIPPFVHLSLTPETTSSLQKSRSYEQISSITTHHGPGHKAIAHKPQIRLSDILGLRDGVGERLALEEGQCGLHFLLGSFGRSALREAGLRNGG